MKSLEPDEQQWEMGEALINIEKLKMIKQKKQCEHDKPMANQHENHQLLKSNGRLRT